MMNKKRLLKGYILVILAINVAWWAPISYPDMGTLPFILYGISTIGLVSFGHYYVLTS